MPPPVPYYSVGNIIEVISVNHTNNQLGLCVSHWAVTAIGGTGDSVTDQNIAQAADTSMGSEYRACFGPKVDHRGHKARRIWTDVSSGGIGVTAQGVGTFQIANPDLLPKQISGIISLRADEGGPAGKGRKYIPFPSQIANDTNETPTPAYVVALGNLAARFLFPITATNAAATVTMACVIFHRSLPGTSPFVTNAQERDRWATQRRRGDYGRTNAPPF